MSGGPDRGRVDRVPFDVTGLINLYYPLFTSGFTSHFGVALRFSGEMLREISKSEKEKEKKTNFQF